MGYSGRFRRSIRRLAWTRWRPTSPLCLWRLNLCALHTNSLDFCTRTLHSLGNQWACQACSPCLYLHDPRSYRERLANRCRSSVHDSHRYWDISKGQVGISFSVLGHTGGRGRCKNAVTNYCALNDLVIKDAALVCYLAGVRLPVKEQLIAWPAGVHLEADPPMIPHILCISRRRPAMPSTVWMKSPHGQTKQALPAVARRLSSHRFVD